MKKRITTLFVFLLIACLMLTACSTGESFEPDVEPAEELEVDPDFVEMNCYDIGDGISIRLNTRIEDYITPDKHFRFFDLAEDLGWREIVYANGMIDHSYVRIIESGDDTLFITFEIGYYGCMEVVRFGTIWQMEKYPFSKNLDYAIWNEIAEYKAGFDYYTRPDDVYYVNDDTRGSIFFSQIVLAVYIMENFENDNSAELFDELLEGRESVAWYIYK